MQRCMGVYGLHSLFNLRNATVRMAIAVPCQTRINQDHRYQHDSIA